MYNLLLGRLPKVSDVTHSNYSWRYRDIIKIEQIMFNEDIPPDDRMARALVSFYGADNVRKIECAYKEAVEELLWFFECGKERKKKSNNKGASTRKRRAYDFEVDAPYIYAAFMEQYNIDLTKAEDMHWWEFMALFESLNENTKMSKIIYYRTADTNGMPDKQRKFIHKMRAIYEIKEPESNISSVAKLAKRDADMKAYVANRMKEINNH